MTRARGPACVLAAALCASAAAPGAALHRDGLGADAGMAEATEHPPEPKGGGAHPRGGAHPPLSPEDQALVRELELLEKAELLRHLELFEPDDDEPAPPKAK